MRPKNMFTASEKVKALGYFDLAIAILTLIVVFYGVIFPYSSGVSLESQYLNTSAPEILKRLEHPFLFWLLVGLFGTLGLIGILWSLVLVKTSTLEENRAEEKCKMMGYWLFSNVIIAIILTCLWILGIFIEGPHHEMFYDSRVIKFSYGTCYFFRMLLICLVWWERKKFSGENEMNYEEEERRIRYVGERESVTEYRGISKYPGRIQNPNFSIQYVHVPSLQIKPYRGQGLMASCKCVAPSVDL